MDKITAYNEIDLTLPGREPCIYFCCISAQDSSLEFLSSLFFSQFFSRLINYGRRQGDHGKLPVRVNVCLEEFCQIGKLVEFYKITPEEHPSFAGLRDIRVSDHVPDWRKGMEAPPSPAQAHEPQQPPTRNPPPQPPPQDPPLPTSAPVPPAPEKPAWASTVEYTVLSGGDAPADGASEPDEMEGYGKFDPIELTPDDIRQAQGTE